MTEQDIISYCQNCGAEYSEGDKYCKQCGFKTDWRQRYEYEYPTLWQWYFSKHPRILILVPLFIYFVFQGLTYGIRSVTDIICFFDAHTWGAIGVFFVFGFALLPFLFIESIVAFFSIKWIYIIFQEYKNAWTELGLTIFVILIAPWITNLIRWLLLHILGIPVKFDYIFLP